MGRIPDSERGINFENQGNSPEVAERFGKDERFFITNVTEIGRTLLSKGVGRVEKLETVGKLDTTAQESLRSMQTQIPGKLNVLKSSKRHDWLRKVNEGEGALKFGRRFMSAVDRPMGLRRISPNKLNTLGEVPSVSELVKDDYYKAHSKKDLFKQFSRQLLGSEREVEFVEDQDSFSPEQRRSETQATIGELDRIASYIAEGVNEGLSGKEIYKSVQESFERCGRLLNLLENLNSEDSEKARGEVRMLKFYLNILQAE